MKERKGEGGREGRKGRETPGYRGLSGRIGSGFATHPLWLSPRPSPSPTTSAKEKTAARAQRHEFLLPPQKRAAQLGITRSLKLRLVVCATETGSASCSLEFDFRGRELKRLYLLKKLGFGALDGEVSQSGVWWTGRGAVVAAIDISGLGEMPGG